MSRRHQPEHGADSAEGLADVIEVSLDNPNDVKRVIAERKTPENAEAIVKMAVIRRGVETSYFTTRPSQCSACSLPAVRDGLCAGHARLGEYRVTDETHWAANE